MIVDVPAGTLNNPLRLPLGGVTSEGRVWMNGQYAGHRPWQPWCSGRQALEMDVDATGTMQAAQNAVAIRVGHNADGGGLIRRGFIRSPK